MTERDNVFKTCYPALARMFLCDVGSCSVCSLGTINFELDEKSMHASLKDLLATKANFRPAIFSIYYLQFT